MRSPGCFGLGAHRLCGAQCKKNGKPCPNPAMIGKNRCRFHGGKSTGARTKAGKDRQRRAVTKHGLYAGPDHPDFGKLPGPRWGGPGSREYRAELRKTMREIDKIL